MFAIITDTFKMEVRGRVMGFVQMASATSQVLGILTGLHLATHLNWRAPFLMIAAVSMIVGVAIILKLKPVTAHLQGRRDKNAFVHLWHTASNRYYIRGFGATMLLTTGGFMIMPFSSAFLVNNVQIPETSLSIIFFITGILAIIIGPILGKRADKFGKYRLFVFGSILSMVMVITYTHLGPNPVWIVVLTNVVLYTGYHPE